MTPGLWCLDLEFRVFFPTENVSSSFLPESSGDIGIPGDQGPGRQHPLPGRSPASFLFQEPGVLRPRLPGRRGSAWRPRWGRGRRGRRWRVPARTSDAAPARPKPGSRRPPRLGRPAPRSTPGLPRTLSDCGGRCCSVRRLARSPTSLPARRLSHSAFLSAARSPARGDMAHAPASCPSSQVSGDSEMGKPRKVALITGITGQVSAGRGRAACGLGARGPRPSAGPPRRGELLSARPGRCVRPRGWAGFSPGSVAFCSLWLWALVAHRTALSHLSSGWLWRFFHGALERAWKEYRTLQSLVPGRKRASDLSIVCGVTSLNLAHLLICPVWDTSGCRGLVTPYQSSGWRRDNRSYRSLFFFKFAHFALFHTNLGESCFHTFWGRILTDWSKSF